MLRREDSWSQYSCSPQGSIFSYFHVGWDPRWHLDKQLSKPLHSVFTSCLTVHKTRSCPRFMSRPERDGSMGRLPHLWSASWSQTSGTSCPCAPRCRRTCTPHRAPCWRSQSTAGFYCHWHWEFWNPAGTNPDVKLDIDLLALISHDD